MTKTPVFKTGGDCDTWCGRCKLELAHTIVAMVGAWPVEVICNTCGGKHKFKKPKQARAAAKGTRSGARRRTVAGAATTRAESTQELTPTQARNRWLDLLAASPTKQHRSYNVRESFEKSETLRHTKFGVGVVVEVIGASKIRVLFEDCEKVLAVNYGRR